jgi:hypothetical protein
MKSRNNYFIVVLLFCTTSLFAQLGIKAGVNMANEIKSFNQADIAAGFNSNNLTGYQIGLVYQAMPKQSGLGVEIAGLLTQKGSTFRFTDNISSSIIEGYKELNYLEVPLNLRYRLSLGIIAAYGFAGIYGGYALSGKVVDETNNVPTSLTFNDLVSRLDYGYNVGAGVELFKKIQLGATWSQGIKNTITNTGVEPVDPTSALNRVMSINLVYLF